MCKKIMFVFLALVMLSFTSSARANFTGCRIHNFIGTFVRVQPDVDLFGDGTAIHTWIYQLQVHLDGTVTQFVSATPEFMINAGTSSEYKGSWTCRSDGKLVISVLEGGYNPVNSSGNPNAVVPDIQLANYIRVTYLFSVDNDNTLTKLQARSRTYGPNEDPTNPTGGHLGNINSTPFTYTRWVASDADLLLP